MTATYAPPDLRAVKARQQAAWATGDYAVIGTTLTIVGETLCEAVDLHAGQRVLDVATGNGCAALAAARRYAEVTGVDYLPSLLQQARSRTFAERLPVVFQEGDAENLPFADASFDVVLSTFGVMFTPDQKRAARELLRVCRPGGTIGLANWTPQGFIGQVFRIIGRYNPPPAGVPSPMHWGTEEGIRELFADGSVELTAASRHFVFRYRSAEHWLETFRTYYGPLHKTFAALDPAQQESLRQELLDLLADTNRGGQTALAIPSEYLEVVAVRRP